MQQSGKLILVSLPIGNLKDVTLRALETLATVKYVAAEDTREVGSFFAKHNLPKPTWISYRDQNHDYAAAKVLDLLNQGEDVVLVSDRGTPAISDPGFKLVRSVTEAGIEVVSVPGATAAIAALSISGLPTDRFLFLGFLPRDKGKQRGLLRQAADVDATFVIYESPFRVVKLLELIATELGDIQVAAAKELTKLHEQVFRGSTTEVLAQLKTLSIKGEWVIMGSAKPQKNRSVKSGLQE
jgi:16S rRNA (cytidine1402-2'-O)-methyltransferase